MGRLIKCGVVIALMLTVGVIAPAWAITFGGGVNNFQFQDRSIVVAGLGSPCVAASPICLPANPGGAFFIRPPGFIFAGDELRIWAFATAASPPTSPLLTPVPGQVGNVNELTVVISGLIALASSTITPIIPFGPAPGGAIYESFFDSAASGFTPVNRYGSAVLGVAPVPGGFVNPGGPSASAPIVVTTPAGVPDPAWEASTAAGVDGGAEAVHSGMFVPCPLVLCGITPGALLQVVVLGGGTGSATGLVDLALGPAATAHDAEVGPNAAFPGVGAPLSLSARIWFDQQIGGTDPNIALCADASSAAGCGAVTPIVSAISNDPVQWVQQVQVPEPATMMLVGASLVAAGIGAGMGRRRKEQD